MSRLRPHQLPAAPAAHAWTFLSNHAHVLVSLAAEPDRPLREVALSVGITERAVQKILADLEEEGLVTRRREGRRNRYRLHLDHPLRHPLEAHKTVRELIELVAPASSKRGPKGSRKSEPGRRAR